MKENNLNEFIHILCSESINEDEHQGLFNKLNDLRNKLKDPSALDEFIKNNWHEIVAFEQSNKLNFKQKSIFQRMIEAIKYALKNGFQFIKKHWKKIVYKSINRINSVK